MSLGETFRKWGGALHGILGIAARPVRRAQGRGGVVLEPYRGYGSESEVFLIGRVFRQSRPDPRRERSDFHRQLRNISRRIARRAVPGAVVTARFYGAEARFVTDRDVYFRIHLAPRQAPPRDRSWHPIDLTVDQAQPVHAQGQIFIPPAHCRYVVISDID